MKKITNINIDSKSIIIIFLVIVSLFMGYKWYFSSSIDRYEWKSKVKKLNKENQILKKKSDSVSGLIIILEKDYQDILRMDTILKNQISSLENDIKVSKEKAKNSNDELIKLRKDFTENKKKIQKLENNPVIKTNDELIESLKNNIKK